jgi:hypothetical protein
MAKLLHCSNLRWLHSPDRAVESFCNFAFTAILRYNEGRKKELFQSPISRNKFSMINSQFSINFQLLNFSARGGPA